MDHLLRDATAAGDHAATRVGPANAISRPVPQSTRPPAAITIPASVSKHVIPNHKSRPDKITGHSGIARSHDTGSLARCGAGLLTCTWISSGGPGPGVIARRLRAGAPGVACETAGA